MIFAKIAVIVAAASLAVSPAFAGALKPFMITVNPWEGDGCGEGRGLGALLMKANEKCYSFNHYWGDGFGSILFSRLHAGKEIFEDPTSYGHCCLLFYPDEECHGENIGVVTDVNLKLEPNFMKIKYPHQHCTGGFMDEDGNPAIARGMRVSCSLRSSSPAGKELEVTQQDFNLGKHTPIMAVPTAMTTSTLTFKQMLSAAVPDLPKPMSSSTA